MSDDKPGIPADEANETAATAAFEAAVQKPLRGPRIRWGGAVWGALFAAFAGWILAVDFDPVRRQGVLDWFVGLSGGGWAVVGALALGALFVVTGLIAGLRALSRR